MSAIHEDEQSLWLLTFSPTIWAGHFLLSYITASIWCGRFATTGALGPVPALITIFTAAALGGIAFVGWRGWRKHSYGDQDVSTPHDEDTPEDRHRFLGFATVLLSALSAVAVLYVGAVAFFFGTCR